MRDRLRVGLGGVAVGLIALSALGFTAVSADHTETQLTSGRNAHLAQRSNQYYACLDAQAHSLFSTRDVVYLAEPTLGEWTTLTKVIGGWAHVTLQRDKATVAALLQHSSGSQRPPIQANCDGDFLVSIRRGSHGHAAIARATKG